MNDIAYQNDLFRRYAPFSSSSGIPGQCVMTSGIAALEPEMQLAIWTEVRSFNSFTEDNDPYGEHDFGSFEFPGVGRIFWKIDYYAPGMKYGSEDPANTAKTVRVLTIMQASDY